MGRRREGYGTIALYLPQKLRDDFIIACAVRREESHAQAIIGFMGSNDEFFASSLPGQREHQNSDVLLSVEVPIDLRMKFRQECRSVRRSMTGEIIAFMERTCDEMEESFPGIFDWMPRPLQ